MLIEIILKVFIGEIDAELFETKVDNKSHIYGRAFNKINKG